MYKGGVANIAQEETQYRIKQIERIGHRIVKIIPANKISDAPLVVLSTYAPNYGYAVDAKQQWDLAYGTIKPLTSTDLCVWCAGANAKLGYRSIKKWPRNKRNRRRGNGMQLRYICINHEPISTNT